MSEPVSPDVRRLAALLALPPSRAATARLVARATGDGWACDTLEMTMPSGASARAVLTRPLRAERPCPAILYAHAHGGDYQLGAAELVEGRKHLLGPLGPVFAREGYASLAIDLRCFGSRAQETEGATAKRLAWYGRTLLGDMVDDLRGSLAWLAGQPDIAPDRIAAFGLSMGATLATMLGAVEPRVAAVVQLCCFADLAMLVEAGTHDRHGHYMTVPGLLAETSTGRIAGLVAPRPQFIAAGMEDGLTPEPAFTKALAETREAYAAQGAPEALQVHVETDGVHAETEAMRRAHLGFLRRTIGRP